MRLWRMPLFKKLLSLMTTLVMIMIMGQPALANARFERFELMWNDATDAERYFMPTEVKAYACGLSTSDFIFLPVRHPALTRFTGTRDNGKIIAAEISIVYKLPGVTGKTVCIVIDHVTVDLLVLNHPVSYYDRPL